MNESTKTKKALRGSLFALFLCIVLLIGTTFAWFTDTASTGVNKIQSGNLDVDLQMKDANGKWVSAEGETIDFVKASGHENETILWEPGCKYTLPELRVVNNGNLALKYKIKITGIQGSEKLNEVIDWTINEQQIDLNEQHLSAKTEGEAFTIKGHMQESAGNEYQGLSIDGISITVYAIQDTVENDSFGNQYDKDASVDFTKVSSQAELQNAINAAAPGEAVNLSLTGDVTIDDTLYVIGKNVGADVGDVTIQANGKTLTSNKEQATRCMRIEYTDVERDITIIGAKVVSEGTKANGSGNGANENRGLALFDVKNATINLKNCKIEMKSNNYAYAIKMINCENVTLNLTGCTLTGANCIETNGCNGNIVNITNCVFNSNYAPNATYCGQGIQDKTGKNNTFNVKNTTFNGSNAQPWETSDTTIINDLGGNVDNTTRTKK